MIERSVEQMARLGNKAEEASALSFAALLFASTGVFDRALQYADLSIALAVEIKNPIAHATAPLISMAIGQAHDLLMRGLAQQLSGVFERQAYGVTILVDEQIDRMRGASQEDDLIHPCRQKACPKVAGSGRPHGQRATI